MKRMKKIASILLAMVMVLGMGLTAFAAGDYTITIDKNDKDAKDHVYDAYQIFAGDLADNPDYEEDNTKPKYILSNIQWGSGIKNDTEDKVADLLAALQADATIGSRFAGITADDPKAATKVAEVIKTFDSSDANSVKDIDIFAKIVLKNLTSTAAGSSEAGGTVINNLEAGYYMVKDRDDQLGDTDTNASYTRLLLQVVGNSTVHVKSEVPSGKKEIFYQGTDAYHNNGTFVPNPNVDFDDRLNGSNYASMGDDVVFQITSSVPNYNGYDYYYFIMNDTMSSGLTFNPDSVKVVVGRTFNDDGTVNEQGRELEKGELDAEGNVVSGDDGEYYLYTDSTVTGGATFKIAFKDIMETVTENGATTQRYPIGASIIVTYTATVNENAIIGSEGNENAWSLDYSRNPNSEDEYGRDENNKHPGMPENDDTDVLGKTPEHKTLTFLTELDITKYANGVDLDEVGNHILGGAEFTLTGTSYRSIVSSGTKYVIAENGNYYKLLDGSYTTEEPKDDEYVEAGTGTSETKKGYLYDAEKKIYYVPADVKDYNGKTLYKLVAGSASLYADTKVKYSEEEVTETTVVETPISIRLTTNEITGKISFVGLGEGTYTLTETVTPAGYNTIDPISFTITCKLPEKVETGDETCTWTITGWPTTEDGESGVVNNGGIFAADIINKSGSLLPSTGGIGTTIFYVVGGILVIGAGILLVAKKRMSNR